jgi:hypothetical protein
LNEFLQLLGRELGQIHSAREYGPDAGNCNSRGR